MAWIRTAQHAAVVDEVGRELGDAEFPATPVGYRRLPPGCVASEW